MLLVSSCKDQRQANQKATLFRRKIRVLISENSDILNHAVVKGTCCDSSIIKYQKEIIAILFVYFLQPAILGLLLGYIFIIFTNQLVA